MCVCVCGGGGGYPLWSWGGTGCLPPAVTVPHRHWAWPLCPTGDLGADIFSTDDPTWCGDLDPPKKGNKYSVYPKEIRERKMVSSLLAILILNSKVWIYKNSKIC